MRLKCSKPPNPPDYPTQMFSQFFYWILFYIYIFHFLIIYVCVKLGYISVSELRSVSCYFLAGTVCVHMCVLTNAFLKKMLPRSPCGEVWMWPFRLFCIFRGKIKKKNNNFRNIKEQWWYRKLWSNDLLHVYIITCGVVYILNLQIMNIQTFEYMYWICNWMYACVPVWVSLCICVWAPVKLSQAGRQADCVIRWHSKSLYVCLCVYGAGVPGRPAQLVAHLCTLLCAACAHALPTALHHCKKTQENGMLRDEGRDGK